MKNKKEFFAVLFSVLICVFLVFIGVYATTTVGNNVSVGGILSVNGSSTATEFSVLGTASISEDLWASGSFQFGGGESTATVSYSRLGSGTTGHSLADAYDLLITGILEVDGIAYFDSTVVFGDIASANYGLIVDSMLQVGHGASVAYSRFGSGATGHSLDAANDLLISADLEVDGTAYFDGVASISNAGGIRTPAIFGARDDQYLIVGNAGTTGHSLAADDDLLISGILEVDGVAYFDNTSVFGDIASANYGLIVDSMLQVGHGASVAYSRFGSGATGHSLDAANDLLISADLEVDGTAFFDGLVSASDANGILVGEGAKITAGTASASGACGTAGSLYIRTGQAAIDNVLSVCGDDGAWNPADL